MARLPTTVVGVLALAYLTGGLPAQDKNANDAQPQRGEITKVDAQGHTFTVKLRDTNGKEIEKTHKLTGEAKFYNADGKAVELTAFRSGGPDRPADPQGRGERAPPGRQARAGGDPRHPRIGRDRPG